MSIESQPTRKRSARITIRPMDIDDIPSVYHLGERLFTSEEFPILYRTWDAYEVTSNFTSDPEYCFVAEHDDRVVGFVLGTTIEKEGTAWKKYGYLNWIGVDDDFQRMGLGKRLYKALESHLREDGVRMMMADTGRDNTESMAFFRKMGFTVQGQHIWFAKTLRKPKRKKTLKDEKPSPSQS